MKFDFKFSNKEINFCDTVIIKDIQVNLIQSSAGKNPIDWLNYIVSQSILNF